MKISIEDYESRALDYLEGNLPADELPAFEAFLSEHPDLEREIRSMRGSVPVLPAEKWVYPDKKALLRGGMGMSVWLNRAGSFLGGMAAACLSCWSTGTTRRATTRCWPGVFRPNGRTSSGGRKVLRPWPRKSPLRLT